MSDSMTDLAQEKLQYEVGQNWKVNNGLVKEFGEDMDIYREVLETTRDLYNSVGSEFKSSELRPQLDQEVVSHSDVSHDHLARYLERIFAKLPEETFIEIGGQVAGYDFRMEKGTPFEALEEALEDIAELDEVDRAGDLSYDLEPKDYGLDLEEFDEQIEELDEVEEPAYLVE
jgi:hypothetical protein